MAKALTDRLAPADRVGFVRLPWLPEVLHVTTDRDARRRASAVSSSLDTWLKAHHGQRLAMTHSWDEGRYLDKGDKTLVWSPDVYAAETDRAEWIAGTPDIGPKKAPWAAADTTLHWALGNLRTELEVPLATYQEAEATGSRLVYWVGTALQSGAWKPIGDIPT